MLTATGAIIATTSFGPAIAGGGSKIAVLEGTTYVSSATTLQLQFGSVSATANALIINPGTCGMLWTL
jgi:hypothetical protein